MAYRDSVDAFTSAAKACGVAYEVDVPSTDEDKDLLGRAFNGELAEGILAHGYAGGSDIPWTAEEFSLYRFGEIESRQMGYRTDGRTGAVSSTWDPNKYVIGDWTGNPISIDQEGGISYSRHGMGTWRYVRIAKDLAAFLGVLGTWMAFFIVDNKRNIFNDDFEIGEETMARIKKDVLNGLDDEEKYGFVKFLIG